MRRLKILFYWLFVNKNNVSLGELLSFLVKPTIAGIAGKYISGIEKGEDYKISFSGMNDLLFWPSSFSIPRLYQVVAETFDIKDWHYYQKKHTEIEAGDILLDIGAAEGLFSLTVIGKCSHVYMVEPGEAFNRSLHKTFRQYTDKVTICNVATGNEDGEIFFSEDSLDGKISDGTELNATKVEIKKVDTLMGNNKITYLKADIEGFELEMLKGAERTIKSNKPKIAITTYHDQNDPEEIIALIKSYVPEYNYYVKGIYEVTPKPVLIHFWI
jgi:FkbM family methyltransferase